MQPDLERRGGFLFNVNVVFLSQIGIYGFAFLLRVVLARGLGDSDLGTYALFYVAILVAGGVANLGIGLGNIYFLNKGAYAYRVLLSNSLAIIIWTAIVGWVVVGGWALLYGRDLFITGDAYWLWGVALPAVVAYTILTSFLHGASRFTALQTLAIAQGGGAFIAVAILNATGNLTVGSAVAAWTASFAAADLICLALIGIRNIDLGTVLAPRREALKEQLRYGVQGQMANMAALFNYRVDQFLVAAFVSRAGVGHYTVAVGLSESVWWISSAVSLVMLPRLTAMSEEGAQEVTPLVCRNTLFVSLVAGLGLVVVSPVAIRALFGSQYYPDALLPFILLMPGIVAASATRVLGSYLFSQGRVIYNTYATVIALGLDVLLDLIVIPLFHVNGAAAMSSVAYVCALIATLYWYRGVSGGSIREALIWRPSDRSHYLRILRRFRDRGQDKSDDEEL
ncbi:MAG: oligosaccharide flippase family protein [Chloroflexota bacterium]|nr:oligosaccharide flippase family protein [Chloroflexota bacterium]